jgi:hypothetical protein
MSMRISEVGDTFIVGSWIFMSVRLLLNIYFKDEIDSIYCILKGIRELFL